MYGQFETDEQLASWGRAENARRRSAMDSISSEAALKEFQAAYEQRRKDVGLTASQAAVAVSIGQATDLGESLSFAMRRWR